MAIFNDVECFMLYMYNRWDITEAKHVFGENLGSHIYEKWLKKKEFSNDVSLTFYADLDRNCRNMILKRAKEIYSYNNLNDTIMKKKTIKFTNKRSGETKEMDSTLLGSHVFDINKSMYEMNDAVRWCNNHDTGDKFDCDDYTIEIISIP